MQYNGTFEKQNIRIYELQVSFHNKLYAMILYHMLILPNKIIFCYLKIADAATTLKQ